MNVRSFLYGSYALLLGILAIFTGEIVTFLMLGFVLMALNNIHKTLQEIRDRPVRSEDGDGKAADSGENPQDR